jgi:hypothetical protein
MVLELGLFMGLGAVSLWALVQPRSLGVVLGAGYGLGAILGLLAAQ